MLLVWLIELLHGRLMWCGDVQNHVFYQTEIFGIFSLAGGGDFAFSKREFPVNMTDVVDVGTTRSPQSPTFRQSQAPFLVAATPSSAISPDLTKIKVPAHKALRHITSIWRSADYPAASGNVLPAGPAAGGSTRSAGTTTTPLLQTSGGLPSDVVSRHHGATLRPSLASRWRRRRRLF